MTGAEQIRELVGRDTVLMPGVYDALTARIAARVGFDIVFISGYSVSATRLGEPDFGFLTADRDGRRRALGVPGLRGAGDRRRRHRLRQPAQRHPHRARPPGRGRRRRLPRGPGVAEEVRPHGGQAGRRDRGPRRQDPRRRPMRAASATSSSSRAPTPASRSGSTRRSSAASPTGRPAPTRSSSRRRSRSTSSRRIAAALPGPLVANMIERGVTPQLSRSELEELGFALIVCPLAGLFAAAKAVTDVLTELRDEETTAGALDSHARLRRLQRARRARALATPTRPATRSRTAADPQPTPTSGQPDARERLDRGRRVDPAHRALESEHGAVGTGHVGRAAGRRAAAGSRPGRARRRPRTSPDSSSASAVAGARRDLEPDLVERRAEAEPGTPPAGVGGEQQLSAGRRLAELERPRPGALRLRAAAPRCRSWGRSARGETIPSRGDASRAGRSRIGAREDEADEVGTRSVDGEQLGQQRAAGLERAPALRRWRAPPRR